jgi:thiopeptide-type bacteriocin biosynthesis protein
MNRDEKAKHRWVSLHVYSRDEDIFSSAMDELVLHLADVVWQLRRSAGVGRWFYVRYRDPQPHVRLRLECSEPLDWVISEVTRCVAVDAGRNASLSQGALFVREVPYIAEAERYGGSNAISICESVFSQSADASVEALRAIGGLPGRSARLSAGLAAMNLFARNLLVDMQRAAQFGRAYSAAGPMHEMPRLSARFTSRLCHIWNVEVFRYAGALGRLGAYLSKARRLFNELDRRHNEADAAAAAVQVQTAVMVVPSLVHMHMNRLGLRRQEEAIVARALYNLLQPDGGRSSGGRNP